MAKPRGKEDKTMDKRYQNRDSKLETSGKIVGFYEREFYCFSNFSSFTIKWRGRLWQTSEHAYQASYFFKTAPGLVKKIHKAKSAHEAYKLAKVNSDKVPQNWKEIKKKGEKKGKKEKRGQEPFYLRKRCQELFYLKSRTLLRAQSKELI